jgi:solute carrier family 25 (mitochondrial citrate transporter), member 1
LSTLYTGLQKTTFEPGQTALQRVVNIASDIWKNEGFISFYKGITPRVLRVAPGQAIVFAVYERVSRIIEKMSPTMWEDEGYSE